MAARGIDDTLLLRPTEAASRRVAGSHAVARLWTLRRRDHAMILRTHVLLLLCAAAAAGERPSKSWGSTLQALAAGVRAVTLAIGAGDESGCLAVAHGLSPSVIIWFGHVCGHVACSSAGACGHIYCELKRRCSELFARFALGADRRAAGGGASHIGPCLRSERPSSDNLAS